MPSFEVLILITSALIILSVVAGRLSHRLGMPVLLLFLGLGMFAGEEGPGGIVFNDRELAQFISIGALVFILFAGGLDTSWKRVRNVVWSSASLASIGVFITAVIAGCAAMWILELPLYYGLLIGAIISSTDAAAVFAVLRSRNAGLKGNLQYLLEFESGSNDPMAVFLTVGFLQMILLPEMKLWMLIPFFIFQMGIGLGMGFGLGKLAVFLLNKLKLPYDGLYPVFTFAAALFIYSLTGTLRGSGFLAVYVAGIVVGNSGFVQKRSVVRFFDGMAWLSQITMFITLGLLVNPSNLVPVTTSGLLLAAVLILVARPISVFVSLWKAGYTPKEKLFISWVGLRGAVPIILSTFPSMLDPATSKLIFNIVFFVVLVSTLLQGWTLVTAAKLLGVHEPYKPQAPRPIELVPEAGLSYEMVDFIIPFNSAIAGKTLAEAAIPSEANVILVGRNNSYLMPTGSTLLEEGDTLLVLLDKEFIPSVRAVISEPRLTDEA